MNLIDTITTHARSSGALRLIKFGLVGLSGVAVNMLVFALGVEVLFAALAPTEAELASGLLGGVVSILTNFLLNDAWTWRDRRHGGRSGWWGRMVRYYLVASAAIGVQLGVLWVVSSALGLNEYLGNLAGIAAGVAINFVVNNLWTFKKQPAPDADPPAETSGDGDVEPGAKRTVI